ncbi:MAG: ABC transporter substrate-binding protein [Peptococcaceae bacterium]|nr:ABC transporter substrate-binding protein [Peptococcaceae bacterium]
MNNNLDVKKVLHWVSDQLQMQDSMCVTHPEQSFSETMLPLSFAGKLTCPMLLVLHDTVELALRKQWKRSGERGRFMISARAAQQAWLDDHLRRAAPDKLPEIILGETLGIACSDQFQTTRIEKGLFADFYVRLPGAVYRDNGILDQLHQFTALGIIPFVLVFDSRFNLPAPDGWEALLDPIYHQQIILGGANGKINDNLLLYLHKNFGYEGVEAFAKNIKNTWLHVQIAKRVGSGYAGCGALFVLPYAIALQCAQKPNLTLIWPKEGAYVQVMYLLAKKDRSQGAQAVLESLMGEQFARTLNQNGYPPAYPLDKECLPKGAALDWLGWDYIRNQSLDPLLAELAALLQSNIPGFFEGEGVIR